MEIRPEENSLHGCCTGHGFTSCTVLNFFQALFSLLLFSNEDHLHLHFLFLLYCAVKCSLEYDADYSAFPHAEGCHVALSQGRIFFYILITYLHEIVPVLLGESMSWSLLGVNWLISNSLFFHIVHSKWDQI